MRRIAWCVLTAVLLVASAAPGIAVAAGGHRIEVDGTFHGEAGYLVKCTGVTVAGSGTFRSSGLGRGTYDYAACGSIGGPVVSITGTVTLTPARGGTITGTINTTFHPPGDLTFPVVISGGTARFAHARGTLSLGPFVDSHPTNCDENVCLDWKETGPITGTITHVA